MIRISKFNLMVMSLAALTAGEQTSAGQVKTRSIVKPTLMCVGIAAVAVGAVSGYVVYCQQPTKIRNRYHTQIEKKERSDGKFDYFTQAIQINLLTPQDRTLSTVQKLQAVRTTLKANLSTVTCDAYFLQLFTQKYTLFPVDSVRDALLFAAFEQRITDLTVYLSICDELIAAHLDCTHVFSLTTIEQSLQSDFSKASLSCQMDFITIIHLEPKISVIAEKFLLLSGAVSTAAASVGTAAIRGVRSYLGDLLSN